MPRLWHGDAIVPQTADMLMRLTDDFLKYMREMGAPVSGVVDVLVYGECADYYWDRNTVINICVLADLADVAGSRNWHVFYKSVFRSWLQTMHVSVYGHGIEIMIIDLHSWNGAPEANKTGAWYSLRRHSWGHRSVCLTRAQLRECRKMARQRYRAIMRECRYILRNKMSPEFIDVYLVELKTRVQNWSARQYFQSVSSADMAYKMVIRTGILGKMRRYARTQRSRSYVLR